MACFALLPLRYPLLDLILPLNTSRPRELPHPAEFFVEQEKHYYVLLITTYYGYVVTIAIAVAIDITYFMVIGHACTLFGILRCELLYNCKHKSNCNGIASFYNSLYRVVIVLNVTIMCYNLQKMCISACPREYVYVSKCAFYILKKDRRS